MKYPYNFVTPVGMINLEKFGNIRALVAIFNQMKNVFVTLLFLCLAFSWAFSQEITEKTIKMPRHSKVVFDVDFADQIIIKTWEKSEIFVKAIVNINDNSDNDKFHLDIEETGQSLVFTGKVDDLEELSNEQSTNIHGVVVRGEDRCVHLEIDYEIFLPENAQINLETISGNVELIGCGGPVEIKSISGFIDVSVDPSLKASFELSTITGEVYSGLDLNIENPVKGMHLFRGGDIEAKLNSGGKPFELETISGDIFLRKLK